MTINLGVASFGRAELLLRWLAAREEDVFLLTEISAGAGTAHLLERFRRAGYAAVKSADVDGVRGSVLVSRIPLTEPPPRRDQVSIPSRDRSADKTTRKEMFISPPVR